MENSNEVWQIDAGGKIYEANFEELAEWIAEGSLLPQDKVRRGKLRWIEARKVPTLHGFFNARELGAVPPVVSTTAPSSSNISVSQVLTANSPQQLETLQQTFNDPQSPNPFREDPGSVPAVNFCTIHSEFTAAYVCETCSSYFCPDCPDQNICPMCGAMCKSIVIEAAQPAVAVTRSAAKPVPVLTPGLIDEDVTKGANWFYWIAGLSVVNSVIMLTGANWAFAMGLGITKILDEIADSISAESAAEGLSRVHVTFFVLDTVVAGFFVMLGLFAGKARKWAFMVGLVVYSLDGLIYVLAGSLLAAAIHGLAIFYLIKGMSAIKK